MVQRDPQGSAYTKFTAEQKRKMREAPGNVAAHRIVLIRRTTQIALFCLFTLFFFMTTQSLHSVLGVPVNLFMTMDFLNTLKNSIASHHIPIYALGPGIFILLLTLWGGRIFCGWICPLGTSIDIGDKLLFRKGRLFYSKKRSDTRFFRDWKYGYLLVGLGAIVFGVDVLTFGDPISLITRTFTFCFYAPVAYIWNGVINVGSHVGVGRVVDSLGGNMDTWSIQTLILERTSSAPYVHGSDRAFRLSGAFLVSQPLPLRRATRSRLKDLHSAPLYQSGRLHTLQKVRIPIANGILREPGQKR